MLENSPQFAPNIVGGLYQRANIQQGSENYELLLRTLHATLESTDPINFADNLSGIATDSFQTNAATGILITEVAGTADPNGNTLFPFFFSSRRRHTRWTGDWSSDVCSSD